ncbi:MAG: hypothetical protein FWF29_07640 [Treponema sp.]|nr:hypothetical protein [Treponema sp.]
MHFSNEEKAMWLEDWRKSGKGAWVYAKDNGLVPQTFARWTKQGTETRPGFVEVAAQAIQRVSTEQEILIEKGDIKIHIPLGCQDLRTVIEGLRVTR